jgi:hypothetical protein
MKQEIFSQTIVILAASYILSHLLYKLGLEIWCVAYGILY